MIQQPSLSDELKKLRIEWNKAEQYLKIAENVSKEAIAPAIWELRYSGRRIVDAISEFQHGDQAATITYINDAIIDCIRAQHDSIDGAIAYMAQRIEFYLNGFSDAVVISEFPRFEQLNDLVLEIQEEAEKSRFNRRNRAQRYDFLVFGRSKKFRRCVLLFRCFERSMTKARVRLRSFRHRVAVEESAKFVIPMVLFGFIAYLVHKDITSAVMTVIGFAATILGTFYGWLSIKISERMGPHSRLNDEFMKSK